MHRIGIAFFYHESHSFSPLTTDRDAFASEALLVGDALLNHYRDTATEVGGFLTVLDAQHQTVVPIIAAAAVPAGEVTDAAFDDIMAETLQQLRAAGQLDGMLIALHGAMVTPSHPDPETDYVRAVQQASGHDLPIAVTLDLHANVTQDLIDTGIACFGFQTYPHVDMFEQGVRAATFLLTQLAGDALAVQAFVKLPALLPSINMRTDVGPMHELVTRAVEFESADDIIAASVFGGFPYADIPGAGASVAVLATSADHAAEVAEALGGELWARRGEFVEELPGVRESLDLALAPERNRPVVLADIADNPLSGGSADTTALLHEVVRRDLHGVLFGAMCDPNVLAETRRRGVGQSFACVFGGLQSPEFGYPVPLQCEVIAVSDGRFINDGPMNAGLEVDVEGAALLRHRGIDLLVTGRPITANDPNLFRHLNVSLGDYDILVLKVKNHFRAALEPLVGDIISVDAPGVATNDFRTLPYRHLPAALWPLTQDLEFTPHAQVTPLRTRVN
jgi:microcystin degradation protein MlrC